jgi:hypothetical protein
MPELEDVCSVTPKPTMVPEVPATGLPIILIGDGATPVTGDDNLTMARSLVWPKTKLGLTLTLETANKPA